MKIGILSVKERKPLGGSVLAAFRMKERESKCILIELTKLKRNEECKCDK